MKKHYGPLTLQTRSKKHILLYINALENLGKNSEVDYYVCSFCGNTVEKVAPEKCSVCGASLSKFMKID